MPETGRQMFGVILQAEDIQDLIHDLRREKYLLAADALADTSRLFLRKLERPHNPDKRCSEHVRLLGAPNWALTIVRKQVNSVLSASTRRRLDKLSSTVALFSEGCPDMVFYLAKDVRDTVMLCAAVADLTAQLQSTLWSQPRPIIFTSGTLAVGRDFHYFREEAGLLEDSRVTESVSFSPFDYRENCLLCVPQFPLGQRNEAYYDKLSDGIVLLLDVACGHALVLFTSYAARSVPGQRYFGDVRTVMPDMRITDSRQEVEAFIRSVKGPDYFQEGGG